MAGKHLQQIENGFRVEYRSDVDGVRYIIIDERDADMTGWSVEVVSSQAMFPPRRVTPWINFKRMSTGVNIARRLWDQREGLRQEYEALHGTNHAQWPTQHPGIVLDAVRWAAHPACLFDRWFRRGRRAITMTQFVDPDTESTKVELRSGHRLEPGDNVTANLTLWPALADPALDVT